MERVLNSSAPARAAASAAVGGEWHVHRAADGPLTTAVVPEAAGSPTPFRGPSCDAGRWAITIGRIIDSAEQRVSGADLEPEVVREAKVSHHGHAHVEGLSEVHVSIACGSEGRVCEPLFYMLCGNGN